MCSEVRLILKNQQTTSTTRQASFVSLRVARPLVTTKNQPGHPRVNLMHVIKRTDFLEDMYSLFIKRIF
jgi:hypothetical protein